MQSLQVLSWTAADAATAGKLIAAAFDSDPLNRRKYRSALRLVLVLRRVLFETFVRYEPALRPGLLFGAFRRGSHLCEARRDRGRPRGWLRSVRDLLMTSMWRFIEQVFAFAHPLHRPASLRCSRSRTGKFLTPPCRRARTSGRRSRSGVLKQGTIAPRQRHRS